MKLSEKYLARLHGGEDKVPLYMTMGKSELSTYAEIVSLESKVETLEKWCEPEYFSKVEHEIDKLKDELGLIALKYGIKHEFAV